MTSAVVNGVPIDVLIDSGALDVSLISSDVLKHISAQTKLRRYVLKGDISIADLVVVPAAFMSTPIIIGTDVLNRDGITYVRTKNRQYLSHADKSTYVNSPQSRSEL